ncbi:UDP-N-acetylmuramoyl-L-alanine--D-glutamate ligase [Anderseniella sp. Alg231-50]|uniref:UDP-N-acetylmuramoyl-L-alanine--D-glutamate ligase n=1 Tax=Anderseniella sp. Alg231-50 TaxID=1922226 RepID=UPI000D55BB8C
MTIAAHSFKGKRVGVFGLGRSGNATVDALVRGGAEVLAWDDAPAASDMAKEQGLPVVNLHGVDFTTLDSFVLSPGVPLTHPEPHWSVKKALACGVEIIGDTEILARELAGTGAKLVAITGTNGKSTTTALAGHVLASAGLDVEVGGNIGTAALLLPAPVSGKIYVIELSSYQIDLMPSLKPDVGILMNLTPDHLERHGDMENYAAVKARMFALQDNDDLAGISLDDEWCVEIAAAAAKHTALSSFSVGAKEATVQSDGDTVSDTRDGTSVSLSQARALRGEHNAQNACAAYIIAHRLGLDAGQIEQGLNSFPGLEHRMEEIGSAGRVVFINDSKATNADAAAKALSSFKRIYWIAGGQAKQGGIAPLQPHFDRIAKAYLIGQDAPLLAEALAGHAPHIACDTMATAVRQAAQDAAADTSDQGEIAVLLSPACASFDQYPNFEMRGDDFRACVLALDGVQQQTKVA